MEWNDMDRSERDVPRRGTVGGRDQRLGVRKGSAKGNWINLKCAVPLWCCDYNRDSLRRDAATTSARKQSVTLHLMFPVEIDGRNGNFRLSPHFLSAFRPSGVLFSDDAT